MRLRFRAFLPIKSRMAIINAVMAKLGGFQR